LWWITRDGDRTCLALYERHYSSYEYKDGRERKQMLGPGRTMLLRTRGGDAVFGWREFIDDSGQLGVNCAVFRNEGPTLSSLLVRQAVAVADRVWPRRRLYTYVSAEDVRSGNPGHCFLAAGFRRCGFTKGGLLILERPALVTLRDAMLRAVEAAWGADTSYWPETWSADNPAWGQCAATALAVQDLLGGEIIIGRMADADHYWNRINGQDVDLTARQFPPGSERIAHRAVKREKLIANDSTRLRYQLLTERAAAREASHSPIGASPEGGPVGPREDQ
jgi:hypothetical protein